MRNPTPLLYSEKFLSMDTTENQNQPNPLPDATVSELRELQKMSALLSQILAQGQSALNHPNDRIQQIGKAVTSSLPDSIDSVLAYMRELDPNGEFDQPKADREPDLQLIPKAQTPASSPEQNLYSLCSEVTGETDLKRIRGALLALGQTKSLASKKVQATQDRAKALLVEKALKSGRISPESQARLYSEDLETVEAFVEHTKPLLEEPPAVQKQIDPTTKPKNHEEEPDYVKESMERIKSRVRSE